MAAISGINTSAMIKVASTFGTAVTAGTGNKIAAEITPSFNAEEIQARSVGSGASIPSDIYRGAVKPTVSLAGDGGYRNNLDVLLAALFGTSAAPTEVTVSQGDYKHTITWNTTHPAKYLTFAFESTSTTVLEMPSCAVRSIELNVDSVPGILTYTAELLANDVVLTGTTNDNTEIDAATFTDTTLIAQEYSDLFRINVSSDDALSGSDNLSITSWTMSVNRPLDFIGEIKGSSGNGAPVEAGDPEITLSVTLKQLDDHTHYTAFNAGTQYKCSLDIQGAQIGSGTNKTFKSLFPKIQLIKEPTYAVTETGVNTVTLDFRALKASANPTGMSSTYPYFEITNTLSTSLLA